MTAGVFIGVSHTVLQEREVLGLMLGLAALVFMLAEWKILRQVPSSGLLRTAYIILVLSWFFSVAECFLWEPGLNFCQHLLSGLSALVLAKWCWTVFPTTPDSEPESSL